METSGFCHKLNIKMYINMKFGVFIDYGLVSLFCKALIKWSTSWGEQGYRFPKKTL